MTRKIISISTLHCEQFGIVTTITTDDGGIWEYCAGAWQQLPPIPALPEPESPKQADLFDRPTSAVNRLNWPPGTPIKSVRPLAPGEMESRAFHEVEYLPWFKLVRKHVGAKANRTNWESWDELVTKHGIDLIVTTILKVGADKAWDSDVRAALSPKTDLKTIAADAAASKYGRKNP